MNCVTALIVLGLGGSTIFPQPWTGMNQIENALQAMPRVQVRAFRHSEDAAMLAYAEAWALKCHIVFVAQSAGGNGALRVARALDAKALPVRMIIAFDPPDRTMNGFPLLPVPSNVEVIVNYRQDKGLGGGYLKRARGNTLTLHMMNKTVDEWHIPMPRNYIDHVVREVKSITR